MPLPSNIKSLMSKESVWHKHRFHKISYSEVSVAFIIFHILTETLFCLMKSCKLYHNLCDVMMKNTASISVKDKHKVFISSSILNKDADFLRKEVIINHLVFLRMQNFKMRYYQAMSHKAISFYLQGTPVDVKNRLHFFSSKRRTVTWTLYFLHLSKNQKWSAALCIKLTRSQNTSISLLA